ncbi:Octopine transport system permease protein OccM [Aquicella siphonis]|uniref:Arginine ABC transporter permease protein ArtM n=1 Tax=Aquicella siphonis TaxID=254247 RepID=A0A5E4PKR2_9COXI|nr:ABC transporter permease subunit [Aquicella siphonis]VVC77011.1 Octopine transport system permease protein OccM [Aquicella siphonis]
MMDLIPYLSRLLSGILVTFILMLASVSAGFVLAVIMTMCSLSEVYLVRKSVDVFVFFIRGTPLLVQLFLIYYGAGQFEWIRESWLWVFLQAPMACAILALSVNSACYTTVLLQGAIKSVPANEIAACDAIGMPKWLAFRRIIFPRAFRLALPAYSNEVIMILKGTSLASTITLLDLMGVTQQLIAQTYETVQFYLLAGLVYLGFNAVITAIFRRLQKWSAIPQRSRDGI